MPGGEYALPVTSQRSLAMIDPAETVSTNDRLTIGGKKYRINSVEFDGGSLNRLELSR
ncbi:MAG: hypothetical protein Alpg2KO_00900 [Alphaproteobacteria bacterium]